MGGDAWVLDDYVIVFGAADGERLAFEGEAGFGAVWEHEMDFGHEGV